MSKKKYLIIFVLMNLLMSLGILGFKHFNREGDTSNVKTIIDEDSMYSKEDIDEATSVIFNEFKKYPAKMESLSYDEKKCEFLVDEYKDKYNAKEVIVFYSDFVTYSNKSATKFLNLDLNQRYSDWIWILTRNDDENWTLREWGY